MSRSVITVTEFKLKAVKLNLLQHIVVIGGW